ncbi:MAG: ferritin-like domain-containing protein [Saprospiraceae bacterium]|nr:ferritin-like domain-containing protein [Saprospiraceae bacterium]
MKKIVTAEGSGNPGLQQKSTLHRRDFLRYSGYAGVAVAGASLISIAGCQDKDDNDGVDFGTGDFAILNYAYALEQLEAAFYQQVIASPYAGMSALEKGLLTDVRDHEIAHREFFKAALGANAIQDLEVDFSSINFSSRDSVLNAAKSFEDLGVSAYNGAGRYFVDANYLLLAGKIVSVEARHAAYIRDLLSNGSFADSSVIDGNGLDTSRKPRDVIAIANAYIVTELNANTLPA